MCVTDRWRERCVAYRLTHRLAVLLNMGNRVVSYYTISS